MNTTTKIKDILLNFCVNYFWGIIQGACFTTGIGASLKLADTLGNYDDYVANAAIKDMMYTIISTFHSGINLYWEVMGQVDIIILFGTIILLLIKAFIGSNSKRSYP